MKEYVFYNNLSGDIYQIKRLTDAKAHQLCGLNASMHMSCILESEVNGAVLSARTQELDLSTTPISVKKVVIRYSSLSNNLKEQRNRLLTACDWTVGVDSPLSDAKKAEWLTYRQALRDFEYNSITQDYGIPWPAQPS